MLLEAAFVGAFEVENARMTGIDRHFNAAVFRIDSERLDKLSILGDKVHNPVR